MGGPPIDITPRGDLLVWGGLVFLALIGLLSAAAPRMFHRRGTATGRSSRLPQ